ncbi:response regulator [Nitrospira sp. M1]
MKRIEVKHAILLFGMILCLTFLYIQVQAHNSHHHQQRMLVLHKMKHWETLINQDILRVQTGLLAHYDTLRIGMSQLWDGYDLVTHGPLDMTQLGVPAFKIQLESYERQLQEKEKQLREFKTQHSTLRNSLLFFPMAMEDLLSTMEQQQFPLAQRLKAEHILNLMLVYIQQPDPSKKQTLQAQFETFSFPTHLEQESIQAQLDGVVEHAAIILAHQDEVQTLARHIITSGSDRKLQYLTHDYVTYRESQVQERERYLTLMYLLGITLIGYVAFLIVRLQLSAHRLDRANNELEQRVAERTKELASVVKTLEDEVCERKQAEEQLAIARDKALAAMDAKSTFLATMSHEIRTPMNGVIGMTGLLMETSLSQEQQHYAEIVRSSGEFLLTVINDILDFSKIEAGKVELESIDFDLRVAVEDTLELLAEKATTKNIELVGWVFADVPTTVQGDPGRLRQILMNLIGNAIKFTDMGYVRVQALKVEEREQDVMVRFEVTDTGVGITPEAVERLFQPFSQADNSTTRKYGGTGLGLAICKQLVQQMGGELGVHTTLGKGSQFWFTIKLGKQAHPVQLDSKSTVSLQGIRVCCVDDQEINRLLVMQYCVDWGMEGVEAATPTDALKILRVAVEEGKPFDLAIVDMKMPEMDGMRLAQTIKADPAIAGTKLILVTSLGRRGDAALARKVGFSGYFTKPVRKAQLLASLKLVIEQTEAEVSSGTLITQHTVRELEAQQGARILVADDHTVNQQLAVLMLEKLGHRVDVVANGLEAVEALSRKAYDVVLMDCQMPEMDGYDATQKIRESEATIDTPEIEGDAARSDGSAQKHTTIIAMTANAMQGDREKCLAAGMDDYISKPINKVALEKVLALWLPINRNSSKTEPVHVSDHTSQ